MTNGFLAGFRVGVGLDKPKKKRKKSKGLSKKEREILMKIGDKYGL